MRTLIYQKELKQLNKVEERWSQLWVKNWFSYGLCFGFFVLGFSSCHFGLLSPWFTFSFIFRAAKFGFSFLFLLCFQLLSSISNLRILRCVWENWKKNKNYTQIFPGFRLLLVTIQVCDFGSILLWLENCFRRKTDLNQLSPFSSFFPLCLIFPLLCSLPPPL